MYCQICGNRALLPEPSDPEPKRGCNCPAMRKAITNFLRQGQLSNHVLQLAYCRSRDVPIAISLGDKTYRRIMSQLQQLQQALEPFRTGFWTSDVLLQVPPLNQVTAFTAHSVEFTLYTTSGGRIVCTLTHPQLKDVRLVLSSHRDHPDELVLFSVDGTLGQLTALLNLHL